MVCSNPGSGVVQAAFPQRRPFLLIPRNGIYDLLFPLLSGNDSRLDTVVPWETMLFVYSCALTVALGGIC